MHTFVGTGHIGQDCELRYTRHHQPVVTFRAAFDEGYGERKTTLWLEVVLAGKMAESPIVRYLVKGQLVSVQGTISVRDVRAADGRQRHVISLLARDVKLFHKKEWQQKAPQQAPALDMAVPEADEEFPI